VRPGPRTPRKGPRTVNSDHDFTVTNPADAAALVPYLLGFHPHDRLVILALQQGRLHFTVAAYLPYTEPVAAAASTTALVADKNPDQIMLFGYGDHESVSTAVDYTTAAFHAQHIPVLDAFALHDDRIWHLHCRDSRCDYDGVPFTPDTTVAAAYATYHGLTAAADIEALDARLDPVTGAERDAMTHAYHRAARRLARLIDGYTDQQALAHIHRLLDTLLAEARRTYQTGRLTDDRAALLITLVDLPPLRDRALRHVDGDELHIRIWTDLTRRAPADGVAGPATLLAVAALQLGHGAQARLAIQRAQRAEPTDPLIDAIADCIRHGVHPDTVHRLLHE
jgi:hypothetical protein